MDLKDFDYVLPAELIAQHPAPRGQERLMVVDRRRQTIRHHHFEELSDYLGPGDLLVMNDTRVIPARLHGLKTTGGRVELLLLKRVGERRWRCLIRTSKPMRVGMEVHFDQERYATVLAREDDTFIVELSQADLIEELGQIPLPPYIERPPTETDTQAYQTVYARHDGSVAAPTAGLHFTHTFLAFLSERSIELAWITLHVGAGTFQPVRSRCLEEHRMHAEDFQVSPQTASAINKARREGRRVVAVGTTTTRVLEHLAGLGDEIVAGEGSTELFIVPGSPFRCVGALLTNFHLPRSTLLMLVAAFGGYELIMRAYAQARERGYRFYSYGDAMFII